MSTTTPSLQALDLQLPETAPQLRITTGLGTATEKSWNIKRPVTLIGARRPAHIVLHDRKISAAHCVIINDGTHVFVKDLYSRNATFCNGARVDLAPLFNGDVLIVNGINIQVSINTGDHESQETDAEPDRSIRMVYDVPVEIGLVHTHQRWLLREGVTLVGTHEAAPLQLEHEDISRRHAIIFKFDHRPAVFDLGGPGGLRINGRLCTLGPLKDGDRFSIGPYRLQVTYARAELGTKLLPTTTSERSSLSDLFHPFEADQQSESIHIASPFARLAAERGATSPEQLIEAKLDEVAEGIYDSWGKLDTLQTQLLSEATHLGVQEKDLGEREAELDSLDAALRGQLHDIERLEEELKTREREIHQKSRKLDLDNADLAGRASAVAEREAEATKRSEELSRREHVFAQRWSRLKGCSCPHCGKTI
jgi:pSer/pThr/pTyr-binding forkhead associated (FHA) protein